MRSKLLFLTGVVSTVRAQIDDFSCPDEFEGFYPHLYSCDKYWHCENGSPDLKTCGNGLGFLDTDPTFTLEQCAELHLVECGERTELEPPISTEHCPRLFGTFADPEDCGVFWKCQDGKANRYNCPPGLAYDQVTRGCKWADQVPECASPVVVVDEEGGEFQCPRDSTAGTFTKHPHPADCRLYFLCMNGQPRELGCPVGEVFSAGSGNGIDGKCTGPEEVPECRDYYGDDVPTPVKAKTIERSRSSVDRIRNSNSILRTPTKISAAENEISFREPAREKARPAPPALQAIVDGPKTSSNRFSPSRGSRPSRPQARPEPQEPVRTQPEPSLPPRLSIQPISVEPQTERPARIQVLTEKPLTTVAFEPPTTAARFPTAGRPAFSPAGTTVARLPPTAAPTTAAPAPSLAPTSQVINVPDDGGLPPPSPAKPGPNGEEYYYYYYYYDDEEGQEGPAADYSS